MIIIVTDVTVVRKKIKSKWQHARLFTSFFFFFASPRNLVLTYINYVYQIWKKISFLSLIQRFKIKLILLFSQNRRFFYTFQKEKKKIYIYEIPLVVVIYPT